MSRRTCDRCGCPGIRRTCTVCEGTGRAYLQALPVGVDYTLRDLSALWGVGICTARRYARGYERLGVMRQDHGEIPAHGGRQGRRASLWTRTG